MFLLVVVKMLFGHTCIKCTKVENQIVLQNTSRCNDIMRQSQVCCRVKILFKVSGRVEGVRESRESKRKNRPKVVNLQE